jgi:restriction system protein
MAYTRDPWKDFGHKVDRVERDLKAITFQSAFGPGSFPHAFGFRLREPHPNSLASDDVAKITSEAAVLAPHGYDLLYPLRQPAVPAMPEWPAGPPGNYQDYIRDKGEKLTGQLRALEADFAARTVKEAAQLEILKRSCLDGDARAIGILMQIALIRHPLPKPLQDLTSFSFDPELRLALCTIEIPSPSIVKQKGKSFSATWVPVSAAETKRARETILYGMCIRAAYLIAHSNAGDWFETVAINAHQKWRDPATGGPRDGIIASFQATTEDLLNLHFGSLDPKSCFRHFKGIATPSVDNVAPVRPIFTMNKDDGRIVPERNVDERLDDQANLAAMPWEDFEHLVRQLFEWEFGRNGVEVKVTRASRDRGVDAIMFDPDPLRGGKYVLQAKRYTRLVDVAAVRDLYGTVVNEGANRGILVTTSSFGPDSYEFAKDKPISLVDGPNLLAMLQKHGRNYRINLAEARQESRE